MFKFRAGVISQRSSDRKNMYMLDTIDYNRLIGRVEYKGLCPTVVVWVLILSGKAPYIHEQQCFYKRLWKNMTFFFKQ